MDNQLSSIYGRVYVVHNQANDKFYVGQTTQPLRTRWRQHKKKCSAIRGHGILSKAIQKYGSSSFEISEVGVGLNKSQLDNLEKLWIILLRSNDSVLGYNRTSGGDGSLTPESRQLMRIPRPQTSLKLRGRKRPPHVLEILRQANLGRKHTQEWKTAHSACMLGRKHSPETKLKMSESRKRFWASRPGAPILVGRKYANDYGAPTKQ